MTLFSWLRKREIGSKCSIGDIDNVYKSVYSSFEANNYWNDTADGNTDYGGVFNLEFSLDGALLVAACEKKSVVLLDPTTAKPVKIIYNAHNDCVNCVKFLDDRIFATCSDDSTVALWDTRNLRSKIKSLNGHSNWVKNIEYSKKDELLVTSGFDGSIYTWDINSSTENGFVYQKVFNTAGLMRCRVSSDATRLVICTTGGYLIIIHNLDLTTLGKDLDGFRPNLYRLMQTGSQYYPCTARYQHIFSPKTTRNRVEFITDFPQGNDAEVVSSLQIHPQGWCALSRNMSYDESSEWTCVHDIQELQSNDDELADNEKSSNDLVSKPPYHTNVVFSLPGFNTRRNSQTANTNQNNSNNSNGTGTPNRVANRENFPPDIWATEISIRNRSFTQRTASVESHVYGINSGIIRPPTVLSSSSSLFDNKIKNISENKHRLLFYIREPNKAKGFIKELSFSSDGRVICSPNNFGIRLLAFDKNCSELPFALDPENKPRELQSIKSEQSHSDIVVSTKFSPKQPLLVSGCLKGKIAWHYPIL